MRTARDQYLAHFGKIGTGDIILLAQEIEKAELERERAAKTGEDPAAPNGLVTASSGEGTVKSEPSGGQPADSEADVKMDEAES